MRLARGPTCGGGRPRPTAIQLDGTWSGAFYGPGLDNQVTGLAMVGDDLYLGGWFDYAGSALSPGAAMWDGANWSALGSGPNPHVGSFVQDLVADAAGQVYAAGSFDLSGVESAPVAGWDGASWSALGTGLDFGVQALAWGNGGKLYVGGEFGAAGGKVSRGFACWTSTSGASYRVYLPLVARTR